MYRKSLDLGTKTSEYKKYLTFKNAINKTSI